MGEALKSLARLLPWLLGMPPSCFWEKLLELPLLLCMRSGDWDRAGLYWSILLLIDFMISFLSAKDELIQLSIKQIILGQAVWHSILLQRLTILTV